MRTLTWLVVLFSFNTWAGELPFVSQPTTETCSTVAAAKVEADFKDHFFSAGVRTRTFESVKCERRNTKAGNPYQYCELATTSPQGPAITFGALLSEDCVVGFASRILSQP